MRCKQTSQVHTQKEAIQTATPWKLAVVTLEKEEEKKKHNGCDAYRAFVAWLQNPKPRALAEKDFVAREH